MSVVYRQITNLIGFAIKTKNLTKIGCSDFKNDLLLEVARCILNDVIQDGVQFIIHVAQGFTNKSSI